MLGENIELAFSAMLASKLRTFLTMLGIIIGIASVIAITTIGNSSVEQTKKEYSQMGTNIINFYIYGTYDDSSEENSDSSEQSEEEQAANRPGFTQSMITNMVKRYGSQIDQIIVQNWMASGKVTPAGAASNSTVYANVYFQGVNNGYLQYPTNNITFLAGGVFSSDDLKADSDACIVSDHLVNNLFGGDNNAALGQYIEVTLSDMDLGSYDDDASSRTATYSFRIVGVYSSGIDAQSLANASNLKDMQTDVYIPYLVSQSMMKSDYNKTLSSFELNMKPGTDVFTLTDEISDYLKSQIPADKQDKWELYADNNATYIRQAEQAVRQRNLQSVLVAAIALLVGGIGVMNIMTVSIMERTREIGTRKALGATNGDIRMQFITEAVLMCLIGGGIGIAAGIAIGVIACHIQYITPVVSINSIWISFLVSMAIGVFFGYYPAAKAAKMDPIDALRYE